MWEFGSGLGWMFLMMILFLGVTVFLVVWGVSKFTGRDQFSKSTAMEVVEERYARGEIEPD